jgi:hypothetical protein
VSEAIPLAVVKRGPGRPRKAVDPNVVKRPRGRPRKNPAVALPESKATVEIKKADLVFRCDKYPYIKIMVPEWTKNERLKSEEYVRFLGGVLDLDNIIKARKLKREEIAQALAVLDKTDWVYMESPPKGEKIRCPCGAEMKTAKAMRLHEFVVHGEELNVVRAKTEVR